MQFEKLLKYLDTYNEKFLPFLKSILLVSVIILLGETSFAQTPWSKLASLPVITDYRITALNGKIYAVSSWGFNADNGGFVYEYNPALNTWQKKSRMNVPRATLSFSIVPFNNKIYVISGTRGLTPTGGYINTPQVEIYDPLADEWNICDSLLIGRAYIEACSVKNKLFAINGHQYAGANNNHYTYQQRLIEEYSSTTKHWEETVLMPKDLGVNRVAVLTDTIYLFCVTVPFSGFTTYLYLPGTGTFEKFLYPMNIPRGDFAVAEYNKKIFCFGGLGGRELENAEVYDPIARNWKFITNMPKAAYLQSAVELNGKIYVAGGYNGPWMQGRWITDFYEYDPSKDSLLVE